MRTRHLASVFCVPFILIACGGDDGGAVQGDNTPYTSDPNKSVVVGGQTPSDAQVGTTGCVTLPDGRCVDAEKCKDGERRDVIVDSTGKIVDVVCYPANANPPVINEQGDVDLAK